MNVVVFSGTTEGRELSRQLAALGIEVTVSVATPLGQEEQGSTPGVTVRCGRLLPDEMAALLGDAALCIDATHPYAVEATKNIKVAAEKAGVGYLRLLRPAHEQEFLILPDGDALVVVPREGNRKLRGIVKRHGLIKRQSIPRDRRIFAVRTVLRFAPAGAERQHGQQREKRARQASHLFTSALEASNVSV